MNENEVPRERLKLRDDPEILSPPIVVRPYACGTAVTVLGFAPQADLELEIDGTSLPPRPGGFPDPDGFTFTGIGPLAAGQVVRARQIVGGVSSDWSQPANIHSRHA